MNNNIGNASVVGAAQNLSAKSLRFVDATSAWISGNIIELLVASAAGVLIALILLGLRSLGGRLIASSDNSLHWRIIFARALSKTNLFFIVMTSAEIVAEYAATPLPLLKTINFFFVIAAAIQAAIWARELILGFIQHRVGDADDHTTLGSAIGIIRLLVTVALFAIAIILILDNLGVNVTGLIAGLGVGGIAIGLAAQGIFSDLFAALAIIFDRPFRRGDGIKVDELSGTVERIGLKTTRLRALSGEQVVLSNAHLLDKQIHNFASLDYRRIVLPFGLIYQTAPDVCARVPDMIRAIIEAHDKTKLVRCGMIGFGASSLDYELQFDVHSPDYEEVFRTKHAICIEMLQAFAKAGIEFAYPTQTTFTAAPDGRMIMPYADVKLVATEDLEG